MRDTVESIRGILEREFAGHKIIAVSNCEPWSHYRAGGRIESAQPASGLVSAVEPVMRASGGTWIAPGDGEADRAAVDTRGHVRVPPANPAYTLRRIWLPPDLKRDYYYGLSNETIWPVCHLAFQRPRFSEKCWESYRRVNELFAGAVLEEAGGDPAVILIQDYHFALLPRLLKRRNPALKIAQFWHIPWPAPEMIRILPWRQEILDGLAGNDLLGFHLPEHCEAFRAAVDRTLGPAAAAPTVVEAFPISIDFDEHVKCAASPRVGTGIKGWLEEIGGMPQILGIGIDRIDYTKGIPERLAALDVLFQEHPEYLGRLVFAQVGVPSRGEIPAYRALQEEIAALVAAINGRWSTRHWKPIVYIDRKCDRQSLIALHLLADFCVVSSLHDGMNLVAKEFVASRIDEDGVLVLSEFTGAAGELQDALMINPYSVADIARAMHDAIVMEPHERRRRMAGMRRAVASNNIYRWGAGILAALATATRKESYERRLALSA